MKPNWNVAPEWAECLAMDRDGTWYWYETKPIADSFDKVWTTNDRALMAIPLNTKWKEAIEQRP